MDSWSDTCTQLLRELTWAYCSCLFLKLTVIDCDLTVNWDVEVPKKSQKSQKKLHMHKI